MKVIEEMNLSSEVQTLQEKRLLNDFLIPANTPEIAFDIKGIKERNEKFWEEDIHNFPQNLFFIKVGDIQYFGRKLISDLNMQGDIKELHCSRIKAPMILGVYSREEKSSNKITVYYHPLKKGEKLYLFNQFKRRIDLSLSFPYRYIDPLTRAERASPEEGWSLDEQRASNLGVGESNLRAFSIDFLRNFNIENKVIYDPACSTGEFLYSIKANYPEVNIIGQDLSKQMVEYARRFIDTVYHGDASKSFILPESVDFCFVRFLNSEVVTTAQAKSILPKLIERVKKGGYIIIFGHTPVLLDKRDFLENSLELIGNVGYDESTYSIFEYYILKR